MANFLLVAVLSNIFSRVATNLEIGEIEEKSGNFAKFSGKLRSLAL